MDLRGLLKSSYATRFDCKIFVDLFWFKGDVLVVIVNFKVHVTIIIIYRIIQYVRGLLIATYWLLIRILNFNRRFL